MLSNEVEFNKLPVIADGRVWFINEFGFVNFVGPLFSFFGVENGFYRS